MSLSWSAWEKGRHWEVGLWVLFLYLSFTLSHFPSFSICISIFFKLEKKRTPLWSSSLCVPGASLAAETLLVLSGS